MASTHGADPAAVADLAATMAAVDVQQTTLRVDLSPDRGAMDVEGRVTLIARRDGVPTAGLVLAEAFGAPSFTINDRPCDSRWRPYRWANAEARFWEITLPAPLARAKSVTVAFRYTGRPDWPLDGRLTPRLSWMLPQAAWFPRLGTGRVAEDDLSMIDLTIIAPPGRVTVANGVETVSEDSGRILHRWRSRIPGSAFFVVGEFNVGQTTWAGKTVACYATAPRRPISPSELGLPALLRAEQEVFGAYPQPRLAVLQLPPPWPTGEAHAAPGAILVDERSPDPGRLAHEVAHQWWGLSVQTPLLEGLARYAEQMPLVRSWMTGETTRRRDDETTRLSIPRRLVVSSSRRSPGGSYPDFAARHADLPIREALFRFEEPQRTALVYDKLGAVLAMLADLVGEERFPRLLREFHRRYAGQRAGLAEFQIVARSVARQDLDWFFNQWINGPGMPALRLEHATAGLNGNGYRLTLRVTQPRPSFRLNIPLRIITAAGSENAAVELSDAEQSFEIECKGRPLAVELDPERRLLIDPKTSVLSYRLVPNDLR